MERTIDLFDMDRRKERRERFFQLVMFGVFAMVALSFGEGGTTPTDVTGMQTQLGNVMVVVIPIIKYAASAILLIMFATKLIPALTGSQKETNWWELIGIAAAVIAINTVEKIFNKITNTAFF
jgi:hypothetical protein